MKDVLLENEQLLTDLKGIISSARERIATKINSELVMTYWLIGKRINEEILHNKRAKYGKRIISMVSKHLIQDFGNNYSTKNLWRMIQFACVFPDREIVVSMKRELSWTHLIALLPIKDPIKRDFYIELCKLEKWNTRTLRNRINSMLYERTAISKKPDKLIQEELEQLRGNKHMSPDMVFRDPYFLDFLQLTDTFSEKDLESAIIKEIERFLIEFGSDFSFISRQKRMIIDNEDFYLDLLFFHRRLKRLIAIELKMGKFKASYKGQMELYLRWLDKYEREEGENEPIGLILCTETAPQQIQLLQLNKGEIRIAEYLTQLPPIELLEEKLKSAIRLGREKY